VQINKTKMLVKATENCVANLIAKSITSSNIVVQTPAVVLNTVRLQSSRIDCACQADIRNSYSEDWFEKFMECIDMAEIETDVTSTESEDDDLLLDQKNIVVEAINSMRFDWPQWPIQRLQSQLQDKGLKLEVLEANPIFSKHLSRNCIRNLGASFHVIAHFFSR